MIEVIDPPARTDADLQIDLQWINGDNSLPLTGTHWSGITVTASLQSDNCEFFTLSSATGEILIDTVKGSTTWRVSREVMSNIPEGVHRLIHKFILNTGEIDAGSELLLPVLERI